MKEAQAALALLDEVGLDEVGLDEDRPGLVVEGLSHAFGATRVVEDIGFAVAPGEVHCLMGPSGCGKSTTLRLIAGLETLQAGRVKLDGELLAEPGHCLPPEQRRIGLMFQDLALFPHLTIEGNIAFGIRDLPRAERQRRVRRLLGVMDMAAHAEKYPHMLSGGEQQRVALARALAPQPRLMLLDEAFSALDASLRAEVRDEALGLLREARVPTLLVTHDPEEAVTAGDRVHVMQAGRLVQSGAPEALYANPANEFVANFFGPTLRFSGTVERGVVTTPLGLVAAPGFEDGRPVAVVFRAEAVNVIPDSANGGPDSAKSGIAGRVVSCRRMGPACNLAIQLDCGASITLRKPSETPHYEGMRIALDLDDRHAFVFPRPSGSRAVA